MIIIWVSRISYLHTQTNNLTGAYRYRYFDHFNVQFGRIKTLHLRLLLHFMCYFINLFWSLPYIFTILKFVLWWRYKGFLIPKIKRSSRAVQFTSNSIDTLNIILPKIAKLKCTWSLIQKLPQLILTEHGQYIYTHSNIFWTFGESTLTYRVTKPFVSKP